MFGSIGMTELIVIMVVALVVIGPKRLPELARTLGKALGDFKRATSDFQNNFNMEDDYDLDLLDEDANEKKKTVEGEEETPEAGVPEDEEEQRIEPERAEMSETAPDSAEQAPPSESEPAKQDDAKK